MARTGLGFDSHRFETGRPLVLGGVLVEHTAGLAAHSDGDVVLHALTDAIYGALAAGDIGEHFPDSDPKWLHADSRIFVTHAIKLAARQGCRVGNVDLTILAEAPKLADYKPRMAARIAELLNVSPEVVSVKAKTAEGMGLVGKGEGMACFANILLIEDAS